MEHSERKELENLLQDQGKAFIEFRAVTNTRFKNLESAFKHLKKLTQPDVDVMARNHGCNFKG